MKTTLLARGLVLVAVMASTTAAAGVAERPAEETRVRARVDVEEIVVDVLVVDPAGNPVPSLAAADFVVLADGGTATVTGAEWIPPGRPGVERDEAPALAAPPAAPTSSSPSVAPPAFASPRFPEGRLLVFFFQTDFTRARLKGHMEIANEAVRLLAGLLPTDRVAVLSYDSHLRLWLDFTVDRERIRRAVFDTVRIAEPPRLPAGPFPSIAEHFDYAAAAKAATVEKGLALTARALSPIPGAKQLLFFGWGLSVNHAPVETRDFGYALGCFREARVRAFSLDVTHADEHTLEGSLRTFAELTGGTYQKTFYFPAGALDLVLRGTRGRYLVSFLRPDGPRGVHRLEVRLKQAKGAVHVRPHYED
jgi:VWFA-related protein